MNENGVVSDLVARADIQRLHRQVQAVGPRIDRRRRTCTRPSATRCSNFDHRPDREPPGTQRLKDQVLRAT